VHVHRFLAKMRSNFSRSLPPSLPPSLPLPTYSTNLPKYTFNGTAGLFFNLKMEGRAGACAPAACNLSFVSTTVSRRGARHRDATSLASFSLKERRKAVVGASAVGGEGRAKGGGKEGRGGGGGGG